MEEILLVSGDLRLSEGDVPIMQGDGSVWACEEVSTLGCSLGGQAPRRVPISALVSIPLLLGLQNKDCAKQDLEVTFLNCNSFL